MQCLASHIQGSVSREISLRAVELVQLCADNLGKGEVGGYGGGVEGESPRFGALSGGSSSSSSSSSPSSSSEPVVVFTDGNEVHVKYWFAVFLSLSKVCFFFFQLFLLYLFFNNTIINLSSYQKTPPGSIPI